MEKTYGFLGLLQTNERIIGVGTFENDSEPVCFIEKETIKEVHVTPSEPIPTPTPTPTPTPVPTGTLNRQLAGAYPKRYARGANW
ncbi:MAG: hypothetical protein NT166_23185 [Candidatus Aminicenantes bacterium]|nr:hypothetical protein [Candidatus Aminicenantes bacterium]